MARATCGPQILTLLCVTLPPYSVPLKVGKEGEGSTRTEKRSILTIPRQGEDRYQIPCFRFDSTQRSSLFQWLRKMPQPNLRIAQSLRGNVDCRSVAHLTRASEHGLSGERRRWGRAKSEADTRTEEGDEMDGRTDGWTDADGRGEVPRDRAWFGVCRFVGLERYESSLEYKTEP